MVLSFRTDRSGQTVQNHIRMIRVYTVCNSVRVFWMHYSVVKPPCSNFRMINANFSGVRMFRIFVVGSFVGRGHDTGVYLFARL